MESNKPIRIATRGSALALAQANGVLAQCRTFFPGVPFELKIIRTTGDKLQSVQIGEPNQALPKGLFTKELEAALLQGEADVAVHSLKDLPTDLPEGLKLAAVLKRADVRDVMVFRQRDFGERLGAGGNVRSSSLKPHSTLLDFAPASTIATSSTRRQAQVLIVRPDLQTVPIRGNVGTRLQKLIDQDPLDGLILALAGLSRLGMILYPEGRLCGEGVPNGLYASILSIEEMLPCVGQGAIGLESRENDPRMDSICEKLNDSITELCVHAERKFLHAMGGGCLSPVAAYAEVLGDMVHLRAVSFRDFQVRRGELIVPFREASAAGIELARRLSS